jgi:hypothetical protein
MSPETSGPVELHDTRSPTDDGWPEDGADKPDPGWADDAEDERDPDWPDPGGDSPPWRRAAPPAASGRDGGPGWPGLRPLALAIVAVVALGAGAGVALVITRGLDSSSSAAPSTQPSAVAPGGSSGAIPGGSGGDTIPGGSGGPVEQMFVTGRVTAVSSRSVTIGGGPGRSVTAAITSSTRITGKVTSIGAVKVGDEVSAQITQSNGGQPTVTAIQDPAQAQSGGGLP